MVEESEDNLARSLLPPCGWILTLLPLCVGLDPLSFVSTMMESFGKYVRIIP